MGASLNLPVSLSAWTYTQPPALVTRLESAFVHHLDEGLDRNPSVGEGTRRDLQALIRRGAPARLLGDTLYLGQIMEWVEKTNRRMGEPAVTVRLVGPEDLFQPFTKDSPFRPKAADTKKRAEFLRAFDRLDPVARAVPEISGLAPAFFRSREELLMGAYADYLMPLLRPMGFYLFNRKSILNLTFEDRLTFRHLSLSAMETGLRVFLGDAASRFCLAPGVVTEHQSEALHLMGYHPVGFTKGATLIHGTRQRTPICTIHDKGHAAQWSLRVPPYMRIAATLLRISLRRRAGEESRSVSSVADELGDLELGEKADVWKRVNVLRERLSPSAFRSVAEDWIQLLENSEGRLGPGGKDGKPLRRMAQKVRLRYL